MRIVIKKRMLKISVLRFALLFGSLTGKLYLNKNNDFSHNIALSKKYKSLDGLCTNSDLVISGIVSKDYKEVIIPNGEHSVKARQ